MVTAPDNSSFLRYVGAVAGMAALSGALAPFHNVLSSTTVALAMLLVVLFVAVHWGSGPAYAASAAGVLSFNFFFLPPVHTFTIIDPQNWVALGAFLVTALIAGQLSAKARRRAEEAELARRKIEKLYAELSEAFERASQAEAWRRSEQLKSALLDAVTHNLRTPLTSIKASATTLLSELRTKNDLLQKIDPDLVREMLEVIDEETDRLNGLIEGLLDLARIEAGEVQLRPRWGAVDDIIAVSLKRAEPLLSSHHLEVNIEGELPGVEVDARAVSEAVFTLLDNAAKYSPADSTIRVSARRVSDELIEIAVEDEGQGVPEGLRERIFERFFRVSRDGTSAGHVPAGLGMGLAIARGLVEAHRGKIRAESGASGRGARFVITLPIGESEEQ